jgi:hypothetical protein
MVGKILFPALPDISKNKKAVPKDSLLPPEEHIMICLAQP